MRREQRLRRRTDFERAYRGGRSWHNGLLAVRVIANELPLSRFGFAVGKRVGKAVVRNQVKRRLRESARALPVKAGWDIVVVARPPAAAADFAELNGALRSALNRAGLLDRPDAGEERGA